MVATAAQPPAPFERRAAYQFSLATIMLTIALVAVLLGVLQISPGIGILLAVAATPAFLRTCMITARRKARGQSVSLADKLGTFGAAFAGTLGVLVLVAIIVVVAIVSALFVVCWAAMAAGAL